ncbi:uncharacterized protein [Amphiura filiformis]|uniref:uncharacterized protein n=1 Tax=Amphiura filiformis TaxID=82378 RepID=UPI003B223BF8
MWLHRKRMNRLRHLKLLVLSIQVFSTIVSCHVCVLQERPDASRGDALRWSIPYDERCYCQRLLVPRKFTKACSAYEDGSGDMKLWFVDDLVALSIGMNWNKDTLDILLERAEYCGANECSSNPCEHRGVCYDRIGNYICACRDGFSGSQCEVANCAENTTEAGHTGLRVPWQPSVTPYFPFQVRTAGVAKISVEGSGFPGITAFIGMDNSAIYKEMCACGYSNASLSCSTADGGTINVLTALFGRRVNGSVLCPYSPMDATFKTDCDLSGATDLAVTKGLCDGETSCSVYAKGTVFGDPCIYTHKYLRVTYQCTNAAGNVYSSPDGAHDVGSDTRILFRNTSGVQVEEVSMNVVNLSDSTYISLYLIVDTDGFHIGYEGQEIFISIQGDFRKSNISSVVLEGSKFCSCEAGPSCTEIVDADWRIGVCD